MGKRSEEATIELGSRLVCVVGAAPLILRYSGLGRRRIGCNEHKRNIRLSIVVA